MVEVHMSLACMHALMTGIWCRYSQAAIAAYYRGVWNLFYAQYAILPFI